MKKYFIVLYVVGVLLICFGVYLATSYNPQLHSHLRITEAIGISVVWAVAGVIGTLATLVLSFCSAKPEK